MKKYEFNPETAYNEIKTQWTDWANSINAKRFVLGISGGKDSTCIAYLATKIFGPKNVYGVMMPCDGQKDIDDSRKVIKLAGINSLTIDIGDAYNSIINAIENNAIDICSDTLINLAPRLRMSTLYAVAQSVNGIVLNTCNRSERDLGYATIFGDFAGSYAPIQNLTVTEVIKLGKWLGIPDYLIEKKPGDGLQPLGDEDRLGMKYADVDMFIRFNKGTDKFKQNVLMKYKANKFKIDMLHIPGPEFNYPDYIRSYI